jgi:uncharacterized protein (TIGR00299 family) protein
MKTAYFDCIGGISGDMTLGALIHAGADVDQLREGLASLGLPEWELQVEPAMKCGIAGRKVEVVVGGVAAGAAPLLHTPPADQPLPSGGHSHEHAGHLHSHEPHTHAHEAHTHSHEPHSHSRQSHGVEAGASTLAQVTALIRHSALPAAVKETAERVYNRLAEAEATVHGTTPDRVHFHEVGAVDSIVDVVGAVYALHLLGVERIVCSPLPNGHGFVRCAHGMMPIPPPATAELLKGCPIRPVDIQGELVTPTGAALASALAAQFGPLPAMRVEAIGYGAGTKEFPFPNLLRVIIGRNREEPREATRVTLIEANIDDQSPQLYESVTAALFEAGALDVWLTPILMKKGRPAETLSVLCEPEARERLSAVIFSETTTLGVRYSDWDRACLEREWISVETEWGPVRVKVGRQGGELRTASPEYEDCRTRAAEAAVPVKQVQVAAAALAWQKLQVPR